MTDVPYPGPADADPNDTGTVSPDVPDTAPPVTPDTVTPPVSGQADDADADDGDAS